MSNFSDYMLEGEGRRGMSQNAIWSLDYTGSLAMDLGWLTDGLRSTLSFGMQGVENEIENTEVVGRNYPGPGEYTLSSAATKQSMNQNRLRVITGGFFAQNMLAFQDKYFVTAGLRVDGNSAFGESLGFEMYPKLSGSYVLSDEAFFPEGFGEIKLRAAYGFAGRSPGAFDKVRTWSPVGFNYNEQAFYPNNLGNSALGPERTREYEYGMDGSWFNGRFSAELTYYHQLTSDALFRVASSQTAGGWGKQLENVGEFENKGWEVGTNTTIFNGQNFGWDLGLGLSTNHSKVLSLGGAAQFSVGEYGWVIEGQPVPVIYAKQITNANEKADAVYSSGNTVYGPANPTHIYSANTSIRLPGGLQVSARGEYLKGAYISNYFEAGATGRTIAHPKCYDAYRKVDPNWVQGTLGSNTGPKWPGSRPADMYAWEEGQCFGMATYHYANSESDFAELRDLTLSVPISNLLPGMFTFSDRTDLTISGRNVAFWTHKNLITGHPEQNENSIGTTDSGEFRHDMVKGIDETLPPVSYWTVAMRMIF
jgi:hypothetical protein